VIRNVIEAARKLGKRVIVDPKNVNFAIYRGATLLTPNRKEFAEASRSRADTETSIAEAAQDAMQLADCEAMLVTQSEHGMTLVPRNGAAIHVPAHLVKVRDVSGAGDTVAGGGSRFRLPQGLIGRPPCGWRTRRPRLRSARRAPPL
jgi:D-beta-D-heptose 7-phosphate kinase/D-beta-D-heptose 1-phosphate adenosyltransferase